VPDRSSEALARFWEQRARTFAAADPEGWAAVCWGAPLYFNAYINWAQRNAVGGLLSRFGPQYGDPAVDVGTGTGRWARFLTAHGLSVRGFDVSPTMVARARELSPELQFDVAPASSLPLEEGTQAVISCITVLHHLPEADQEAAIGEFHRLLRPGGACISIVLLDSFPSGYSCFPRSRRSWSQLFTRCGLEPVAEVGEEFATPAILGQFLAMAIRRMIRGPRGSSDPAAGTGRGLAASLYRAVHRPLVYLSYPLEAAAGRWWPTAPATSLAGLYVKR
jgi:SAM-dependent methyltransferase